MDADEGGEKRPLWFQDDTTIVVQRFGVRFTMVRADSFIQSHANDIRNVVRNDSSQTGGEAGRYVFSKSETELRHANHTLLYILAALAAAAAATVWYATRTRRRNKLLRNKLRLIEEERLMRHEKVDKAMREVADDFFQSEYYASLSRRVASGKPLDYDEWAEIERKTVWVMKSATSAGCLWNNCHETWRKVIIPDKLRQEIMLRCKAIQTPSAKTQALIRKYLLNK